MLPAIPPSDTVINFMRLNDKRATMRILVACNFTKELPELLERQGHDVTSCDLIPSEGFHNHYQGDARDLLNEWWDMVIAFPPCTHLAVSGARWFKYKQKEQANAIEFFMSLTRAHAKRIAIENPVGIMSTHYRKPDQIIQPWMFGHGETKATCLWLFNLPKLVPTNIVGGREGRVWKEPPSKDRWKNRSRTYQGIANAMAAQWGNL